YFDQENLDVTMNAVSSNVLMNSVLTGEANIVASSTTAALLAAPEGKSTTVIYGYTGNHQTGAFATRPGIKSLDDLKALPNCKLATTAPGTSFYGYTNYFIKSLGLKCTVTQFGNQDLAIGSVVSGANDGGAFSILSAASLANDGKVNLLIDPTKQED